MTVVSGVIAYIASSSLKHTVTSTDLFAGNSAFDNSTGFKEFMGYFVNNGLQVPFQMLIFAIIPIPYVYLLNLILSAVAPGVLIGAILRYSLAKGFVLTLSSLPHMLVELFAFSLFAAALFRVNYWIRSKVWKRVQVETSFLFEIKCCLFRYFKYVIFLILLAAFLETYVADLILDLFNM